MTDTLKLPDDVIKDFPILRQKMNGKRLAYLDSGASAQKPNAVLEVMTNFYKSDYANIHRGVYALSQRSTEAFEEARQTVQFFLGAAKSSEIIFTRNATEAINLVAATWGRKNLQEGDEVILTRLEHHANIVPWQILRDEKKIVIKVVPVTPEGDIRLEDVRAEISPRTKLISVAHVSNALGTILPVKEIIKLAHEAGALAFIDGCQAVSHRQVDVQALDADFYAFSGHKLYGPTGIGVLYGKMEHLRAMPPYQGGGDMIESVSFDKTRYQDPPHRFEAGTPAIAEAVGLAAAIRYVEAIGLDRIETHETALLNYATKKLQKIDGLTLIGTAPNKAAILSFVMDCAHPHDIGTVLDAEGVCIRAGHHCAQPVLDSFHICATARASLGLYNCEEDIDQLVDALHKVRKMFK